MCPMRSRTIVAALVVLLCGAIVSLGADAFTRIPRRARRTDRRERPRQPDPRRVGASRRHQDRQRRARAGAPVTLQLDVPERQALETSFAALRATWCWRARRQRRARPRSTRSSCSRRRHVRAPSGAATAPPPPAPTATGTKCRRRTLSRSRSRTRIRRDHHLRRISREGGHRTELAQRADSDAAGE